MKNNKRLFLILLLTTYSMLPSFAERAVVDRIVYDFDLMNITAKVLNFQTSLSSPCDVTIPSTVIYKNDTYVVTELDKEWAFSNRTLQYDYNEARLNIEHIFLPNTLKIIHNGAFDGMKRLKNLTIPASVELFTHIFYEEDPYGTDLLLESYSIWGDKIYFPRLESIQVLGTPTIDYNYEKITIASENYVAMIGKAIAGIGTPYASIFCPNLKSFSMPNLTKAIAEADMNRSLCSQYNSVLETLCTELNAKLKENIFYDGTILTFDSVLINNDKEAMADSHRLKKEKLTQEFKTLNEGGIESNLKKTNPEKYIQCYLVAHPDKKKLVDSVRFEFRCFSDINNEIIDAIDGYKISATSCREQYHRPPYTSLFKDISELDERYNLAKSISDFEKEIEERQECKNGLYSFEDMLRRNSKFKLLGISFSNDAVALSYMRYISLFRKYDYYYDTAISMVLSLNEKAKAEYEKNGQYFTNKKEFFKAYISDYKTILKNNKSK